MDIDQLRFAHVPTTEVRRMHETPLVAASDASLAGYGCLVDDPRTFPIEIVRWPAQGWRANYHPDETTAAAFISIPMFGTERSCH
jgi:hypothetical protein